MKIVYRKSLFLFIILIGFIAFAYSNCSPANLGNGNLNSTTNVALTVQPPTASVTVGATQPFVASGGTGSYTYQITNGAGTISPFGIYTAPSNPGSATIQVMDSGGATAIASVFIAASGGGGTTYYSCPVTKSVGCNDGSICESTCIGQLSSNPTCTYYSSGGVPNSVNCNKTTVTANYACPVFYSSSCSSASTCQSTCMGQYQSTGTCTYLNGGTPNFLPCSNENGVGPVAVYSCPAVKSIGCSDTSKCESNCLGQYSYLANCTYYTANAVANTAPCTFIGNISY